MIFLGDRGGLNDKRRRDPKWQRHVADHLAAIPGFSADPAGQFREERPFPRLSAWLPAYPGAPRG